MSFMVIVATTLVLAVAACTDISHRRIPNLLAYVGIAIVICTAVAADWQAIVKPEPFRTKATVVMREMQPIQIIRETESFQIASSETFQAISGALGCFAILLLAYIVGGIGGGDVKLGTFIGAANGFEAGLSILFIGHLLAGLFGFVFVLANCRRGIDCQPSQLKRNGIPMAAFYFAGALTFYWGIQ